MTELSNRPPDTISTPEAQQAIGLLRYYGFDLINSSVEEQMTEWLEHYPARWILQAITEALYQGRYKAVSVNQILAIWQRRGQPLCHFNHEFERIVGGNLTAIVHAVTPQTAEPLTPALPAKPTLSYREMLQELPSARAASKLKRLTEIPTLKLSRISINVNDPGEDPIEVMNGDRSEETISPHHSSASMEESDRGHFNFAPVELEKPEGFSVRYLQPAEPVESTPTSEPSWSEVTQEGELGWGVKPLKPETDPEQEFKEFKEGVVFALSSGLSAQALKPRIRLLLSRFYQIDWLQFCISPTAIDQFIPALEPSEFYNKLKTVAEPGEAEQE